MIKNVVRVFVYSFIETINLFFKIETFKMSGLIRCFKGVLYCYFWAASILAGYAGLFCPSFPLILISNKFYRYLTDFLFTFWQMYPTALLQLLCGTRIHVTGDLIEPGTRSLLIMNHRTRTDWNFLWPAVYHATGEGCATRGKLANRAFHPLKFVLKDAIRHIPGPGWVMQLACFIYIRRLWSTDKYRLKNLVDYFTRIKYKYTLVLFPEGTDLTKYTKNKSDRHAEKYNLQKYEYILHPRTRGFTYLASDLLKQNGLDCIYDVTLLYPDYIPQTEKEIIQGYFPKIVRMHFKRYNKEVLPKTEEGLKLFIEEVWKRKEQSLKDYYENENFLTGPLLERHNYEIYMALIFWTLLPLIVFLSFIYFSVFRKLVVVHTAFLLILNLFNGGFQTFEIGLYNFKRKFFTNPW